MFKWINKDNKQNQTFYLLKRGFFMLIMISFIWFPVLVKGAFLDKDGIHIDNSNFANLISAWSRSISNYQGNKYLQEKSLPTDLFRENEKNYETKTKAQILKGISTTKQALDTQYASCSLSDEEISAVLFFTNKSFARELRKSLDQENLPKRSLYESICKKLTACIEWKSSSNLNKRCEDIVNEAYDLGVKEQSRKFLIEESNLWKDKYQNGNIEDSAYDLMYDIGQVGKILFDDTKAPTQILFYRLPTFNAQSSSTNWIQTSYSLHWQSENSWNQGNHSSSYSVQGRVTNWQWASTNQTTQGVSADPLISQFIQGKNWTSTTTVIRDKAFVNYCVIVGSLRVQELQNKIIDAPWTDPLSISVEELDKTVNDILKNSNTIKQITIPGLQQGQEWSQSQVPADMNLLNDLKEQLESCTKKCDGLRRDERQVCKLQCLCKEYTSPALEKNTKFQFLEEWAFKLRICTIPSKVVLVNTRSKALYTIESILREIQDSINGLYESGELTAKTKTKEFFDTSLSKYKFSKNISFILWIGKKPSTTIPNKKQEQKAEEQFTESLKESVLSSEQERNRYVIIDTYDATKANRSANKTIGAPEKIENVLTSETILAQNKFAMLNDQISDYLDRNANLLLEINEKLGEIDQVLRSLNQKK